MAKATEAIVQRRVSDIHNLLVAGVRRAQILQYAAEQNWGLQERQIDTYIARATEQIREDSRIDREKELGRAINRLHNLYQATQREQDHRGSLAVVQQMSQLLGLAAAAKIELSGKDGGPVETRAVDLTSLPPADLKTMLEITARYQANEGEADG